METDGPSRVYGYRKLTMCIVAVIAVVLLIYMNSPNTNTGIAAVVSIAATYCGVNLFKGNNEAVATQMQKNNEKMFNQINAQNEMLGVLATSTDPVERKEMFQSLRLASTKDEVATI